MRVSLKHELLLTADEAFAKAEKAAEKKKLAKNGGKRGWKRKAKEIESDTDDNSSHIGSDPVLPPEIFDCIVMSGRL